jgi:acetolactate synthase-1/2/3 large subunit
MGHFAAGVVGAALARDGKAFAVVGDGSMLMNCEITTAVQRGAPAVWIVLNDGGYGICKDGQGALGLTTAGLDLPPVDFCALARAMGADGIRVEDEGTLEHALALALVAAGPFVVDVVVDRTQPSPLMKRFESLRKQGSGKRVAGWSD